LSRNKSFIAFALIPITLVVAAVFAAMTIAPDLSLTPNPRPATTATLSPTSTPTETSNPSSAPAPTQAPTPTPFPTPTPTTNSTPTPTSTSSAGSVENDFLAILNSERAIREKTPLKANSCLSTAAYLHSKDMADNDYFSHTSLNGTTFDQRIVAAGYSNFYSLGENIAYAYGDPTAATIYNMWKNSAGHYANMMGDFDEAGLGVYTKNGYTFYTLDLGKRTH